jgi:hypothetical protein
VPRLRRKAEAGPPPQDVYAGLRWTALSSGRNGSILRRDAHPDVYGLVADMPKPAGWTTVVALGDDTTSMYTSTGGGMTGTGGHAAVAAATQQLLATVQAHLAAFGTADDGAYPPYGTVRFHLLTGAAGRYADVPDEAFWGQAADPLKPVIAAMQDVLASLRELESRFPRRDGTRSGS